MANNKFSLFGFTIGRESVEASNASQQSFTPPQNDDGALTIQSAAYYGTYVDLDGTAKNEVELISRYREMSVQPEIESAIEDIVNEAEDTLTILSKYIDQIQMTGDRQRLDNLMRNLYYEALNTE